MNDLSYLSIMTNYHYCLAALIREVKNGANKYKQEDGPEQSSAGCHVPHGLAD